MIVVSKRSTILGILLTNILNFLSLCSCDTSRDDNTGTGDSDEDLKLKQALLLVELLKTDYAKALRENAELRNGKLGELQTCAATTEKAGTQNSMSKAYTMNLRRDNVDQQKVDAVSELATNSTTIVAGGISDIKPSLSNAIDSDSPLAVPLPHPTPWHLPERIPSAQLDLFWPQPPAPPYYGLTQQPSAQATKFRGSRRNPYGFYRRMIPKDYYYYYDIPQAARSVRSQFRRFDYVDAFGEHPNDTARTTLRTSALPKRYYSRKRTKKHPKTTVGSQTLTPSTMSASSSENNKTTKITVGTIDSSSSTTKMSKLKRTKKTTKKHLNITTKSQEVSPHKITASNLKPNHKMSSKPKETEQSSLTTIKHKKQKLKFYDIVDISPKLSTIEKSITNDPVMSQVASELFDEFKGENVLNWKEKLTKSKATRSDLSQTSLVYKTTMKIHLEGSTRYPIPLPENHAFCYTNPYNALCRTFI